MEASMDVPPRGSHSGRLPAAISTVASAFKAAEECRDAPRTFPQSSRSSEGSPHLPNSPLDLVRLMHAPPWLAPSQARGLLASIRDSCVRCFVPGLPRPHWSTQYSDSAKSTALPLLALPTGPSSSVRPVLFASLLSTGACRRSVVPERQLSKAFSFGFTVQVVCWREQCSSAKSFTIRKIASASLDLVHSTRRMLCNVFPVPGDIVPTPRAMGQTPPPRSF